MLLLALRLLLGTNCPVNDPDYTKADRFYTAVAKVPGFFGPARCGDPTAHVDVFAKPSASRRTAEVRWGNIGDPGSHACVALVFQQGRACPRGHLPLREDGYEEPGFVVVEQSADWVRIRLDQGTGWIRLSKKDEVVDYDDLVLNRQAELTEAWDGRVYTEPGGRSRRLEPLVWSAEKNRLAERPVTVTDSRRAGGALWFHVQVLADSPCRVKEPRVLATGWIHGYSAKRQPTVEFFSRGC